jgi:WD40 repeat protein
VRSIHVSPDGSQVVAANNKGRCYVWKLAPDSKFEPLTHIDAHKSYILKALYSPDAKYFASSLRLTSFYFITLLSSPSSLPSALTCFRTPLCRILATCSADKTVKLWNTKDYKLLKTLQVGVISAFLSPTIDCADPFCFHLSRSLFSLLSGPWTLGVGLRLLHRLCVSGHRYTSILPLRSFASDVSLARN